MAHASTKMVAKTDMPLDGRMIRGLREIALIVFGAVALFLTASLITYDPTDPGWSHSETVIYIANAGGIAGAWFADVFLYAFGYLAYLFPFMMAYMGWLLFASRNEEEDYFDGRMLVLRSIGFVLTLGTGTGLAALHFINVSDLPLHAGGILGDVLANTLIEAFNFLGGTLFLFALFLTGVTLFTSLSWLRLMDNTGRITLDLLGWVVNLGYGVRDRVYYWLHGEDEEKYEEITKRPKKRVTPRIVETNTPEIQESERAQRERQTPLFETPDDNTLPALALLDAAEAPKNQLTKAAMEAISHMVELKLEDFGIVVDVVAVHPGPVITRYELQPAPGVKVSQISSLAKDLARSLSVISVRIVEIIPGKSTIGLEIPNEVREIVRLSEILKSERFATAHSPLSIALGKDIGGHPIVADLEKMPHLLVAGTTGSGKSVGLNAMVLSILYNATPAEVRMIMIDPKMLELSVYEGIPHLLAPVVTDMKEAANALRWCIAEMDRRYRLMSQMGVRNLTGFNRRVNDAIKSGNPVPDPTYKPNDLLNEEEVRYLEPLPNIVIIIDELADMMMVVGKKVEELIARLAQKARASGIHLILATQRPSVDVLTGLIKANIPTRIAFQVSAKVDSRTILDQGGAEQLLGHGDMLFLPPGTAVPTRVHGAFVSDQEIHRVVKDLRKHGEPEYIEEILEGPANISDTGMPLPDPEDQVMDELYDQAVAIVTETGRASISGVQRRLRVGYNRAARMVEEMERSGLVGPLQSNGMREVFANKAPVD